MHRSRIVLALATLFALAVFILNALPSSVILDDSDSKITPTVPNRVADAAPDMILVGSPALVLATAWAANIHERATYGQFVLAPTSIARAPPGQTVAII